MSLSDPTHLVDIHILLAQPVLLQQLGDGKRRGYSHVSGLHADYSCADPLTNNGHPLFLCVLASGEDTQTGTIANATRVSSSCRGRFPLRESRLQSAQLLESYSGTDGVVGSHSLPPEFDGDDLFREYALGQRLQCQGLAATRGTAECTDLASPGVGKEGNLVLSFSRYIVVVCYPFRRPSHGLRMSASLTAETVLSLT